MKTKLIKDKIRYTEKEVNGLRQSIREKHEQLFDPKKPNCRKFQERWRQEFTNYVRDLNVSVFNHDGYVGEKGLYEAVKQGNPYALEYAVCFIEIRPYFLYSGYIYVRLLRYLNRAPLSDSQRERYLDIKTRYQKLLKEYREKRGW